MTREWGGAGGGFRGGDLARQRLSLERPQECTAGRLSHSQLKLPRVTHRCKSPGAGAEGSRCRSRGPAAQMGPSGSAIWEREISQ